MNARKLLWAILPLLCLCSVTWSQSTSPASAPSANAPVADANLPATIPTPNDPAELMKAAAEVNGLDGGKISPWHLKASFQLYDSEGKPSEQGTFEEYWAGPHKYKRTYISPSFTQTEWATEDGNLYRTGAKYRPSVALFMVRKQLQSPFPSADKIAGIVPTKHYDTQGTLKLVCVSLNHKVDGLGHPLDELFPTYCFTPEKLIFRMSTNLGGIETVSNQIALFQNRYVPRTVNVSTYGKPTLDIHLESLTGLAATQGAVFEPSSDAQKVDPDFARRENDLRAMSVEASIMQGKVLRRAYPIYPPAAKLKRAEGKVLLTAVIGTDGRIGDMSLVSAPDNLLVGAAAYAVRQWEYEPYQLNGMAIEVGTEIRVVYRMDFQ